MPPRKKKEDFEAKYKEVEDKLSEFVVDYLTCGDEGERKTLAAKHAEDMRQHFGIVVPDSEDDESDDDEDLPEDEDEEEDE